MCAQISIELRISRLYKLILVRLAYVHNLNRLYQHNYNVVLCNMDITVVSKNFGLTWLFQILGLSKRGKYAPDGVVRNSINLLHVNLRMGP